MLPGHLLADASEKALRIGKAGHPKGLPVFPPVLQPPDQLSIPIGEPGAPATQGGEQPADFSTGGVMGPPLRYAPIEDLTRRQPSSQVALNRNKWGRPG